MRINLPVIAYSGEIDRQKQAVAHFRRHGHIRRLIGQIDLALHAGIAQRSHFFQEGHGIEHDPVADHAAAALPQYSARH